METYVAGLCRQLQLRGHRSDVATLDYLFNSGDPLPPYEHIDGIDVIRLPSRGNARYFFAPRLLELLPRYDLVHVHGVDFFVDMLGTLKIIHNQPLVLSTHGGFFHTQWFPSFKKAYFNTATRLSLKGVDRVIASSPKDEELFSRITDNVSLVENGIDFELFSGVDRKVRGEVLVFVGRISRNKRVDHLLEAFAIVRERRPRARLVIVGPDWEGLGEGLEQQARSLGIRESVTFAGNLSQDNLLKTLAGASLFVSASEYEAFGISAVEAMAAGIIVVVNRIRAFQDIVNDGNNGFLTDFSDSPVAAEAIDSALGMREAAAARMGLRAKKAACRYDWRSVAGEIIAIYQQVLPAGDNG
ncbi:GDP-mannose:cellobiosyl-diphosphopolyprenol alpha-mannosyltransferase [bacterium BMS3Abin01]|nr:GDP-mannose:cellobiosyl-diphosphopolyprenol alpha-mannosyltransferase [bacterium BMS3Abin01]